MKKSLFLILGLALALMASAGTREDFKANYKQVANNYYAYPDQNLPALSAAPEGYTPFYINHYGRHGSRWLISPKQYHLAVETLEKADSVGKLSARGKNALAKFKEVEAAAFKRLGELSDIGAEQHQRIATRMYHNFPEVFAGDAEIDAKSTVVIRCILSMQNAVTTLKGINPALRITTDASEHDMYFMNYDDPVAKQLRKQAFKDDSKALKDKYLNPKRLFKTLFTDSKWAIKNVADPQDFMTNLLDLVGNMQSHHQFENVDLYNLFSEEDRFNIWAYNNARWYLWAGYSPLTQNRVPYMEANLLRNFITTADKAILGGKNCATLRFGHESVVLPLVCLMGLNGMDYSTSDLFSLEDRFQSYKVFPMAANVQWIFYRKPGAPVLVKFLLNEHEATFPAKVKPLSGPYYKWDEVKAYLEAILAAEPQITLPEKN
ncbi:MAG: histidine acid phosphatase [Bacteroidales bacterium]|nr:histidine acid phosphatase [Bacteroidales bacterium]